MASHRTANNLNNNNNNNNNNNSEGTTSRAASKIFRESVSDFLSRPMSNMQKGMERRREHHNQRPNKMMENLRKGRLDKMSAELKNKYTTEEISDYLQVFQLFDEAGSGSISLNDMGRALEKLGIELHPTELQALVTEIDDDGNGEISFEEFCAVMQRFSSKAAEDAVDKDNWAETIESCFQVFDLSERGKINEHEFGYVLRTIGGILDEDLVSELFVQTDIDGNGLIDFNEFSTFVRGYLTDDDLLMTVPPAPTPPRIGGLKSPAAAAENDTMSTYTSNNSPVNK